jgi:hypothetical protein
VRAVRTITQVCRHCQRKKVNRPRGLCWSCYHKPGVAVLYPSTSKFAPRCYRENDGGYSLPEPTAARPGTCLKIHVLARRLANGEALFHPEDAR